MNFVGCLSSCIEADFDVIQDILHSDSTIVQIPINARCGMGVLSGLPGTSHARSRVNINCLNFDSSRTQVIQFKAIVTQN